MIGFCLATQEVVIPVVVVFYLHNIGCKHKTQKELGQQRLNGQKMLPECKHTVPLLMRCFAGDADAETTLQLKFHLETCGTCQDQLRLFRGLVKIHDAERKRGQIMNA